MAAWDNLAKYVGTPVAGPDDVFVKACWDEAELLVAKYVGTLTVPAAIILRAKLECGSELFHRRSAPNGISQFAGFDGAPMRVARDPMGSARPLIDPYRTNAGFA